MSGLRNNSDMLSFGSGSNQQNGYDKEIDEERCSQCFNMSYNVPAIQSCIATISKNLFADGIEILHAGETLPVDSDFNRYLTIYFQKCGEDAIRWILTVGLVPVVIVYLKDSKRYIPTVVKPGSGTIRISYVNHVQRFSFFDGTTNKISKEVVVFSGFGYDPDIKGNLTSLISSLLPMDLAASELLDCAINAERIRSNPSFVLQSKKEAVKASSVLPSYGIYAEFGVGDDKDARKMYNKDREKRKRVDQQNDHNRTEEETLKDVDRPWKNNMFYIPEDIELVRQTLPVVRDDLIRFLAYNDSRIFSTLGVPESLITGVSVNRTSNADAVNEMFKATILWWKRNIAMFLTRIYGMLFGFDDAKYILSRVSQKVGRKIENLTEHNLYSIQKDNKIEINLPIPPFTTTAELMTFFQQGALTDAEYSNYLRRRANLQPIDDVSFIPARTSNKRTNPRIVVTEEMEEELEADMNERKKKRGKFEPEDVATYYGRK